jgi:hypothetical protein
MTTKYTEIGFPRQQINEATVNFPGGEMSAKYDVTSGKVRITIKTPRYAGEVPTVITGISAWSYLDSCPSLSAYECDFATVILTLEQKPDPRYCPKCGSHWVTHDGDGSCVED